MVGKKYSHLKL